MQYLEQEIIALTQYIWGATLNLDAVPQPPELAGVVRQG